MRAYQYNQTDPYRPITAQNLRDLILEHLCLNRGTLEKWMRQSLADLITHFFAGLSTKETDYFKK